MTSKRTCQQCGVAIRGWEAGKPGPIPRYCSVTCRAAAARARGYSPPPVPPKPPRQLTCTICGCEFEQSGRGRNRITCGAAACVKQCRLARRRDGRARRLAAGRPYAKPPKLPKPPRQLTCTICGCEFEQSGLGPPRRTCGAACKKLNHQARSRAEYERKIADGRRELQNAKRRNKSPKIRFGTCVICGVEFQAATGGAVRASCGAATCKKLNQQARSRAEYARKIADGRQDLQNVRRRKFEPSTCQDCGHPVRGNAYRCRPCAQALRRAVGRSSEDTKRRQAVFERDQWTCRLCDQPIDQRLAFPHAMSASLDHIVPLRDCLAHFGPDYVDDEGNWQAAHYICNQAKGGRKAS